MIKVSVIICTYNRSAFLEKCIKSILSNKFSEKSYEILIIDNNSVDQTKEIVHQFIKGKSNIKYIKEEQVGLSFARNRGITEAKGNIVAFIDDDVEVNSNYINSIVQFSEKYPDEVCISGKVIPVWNFQKPSWFSTEFASIVGETTYGANVRILNYREYPIGCNMIFKKDIFNEIGLFNTELGIKGDQLYLGEEVEICDRILKLGKKIYYLPDAFVYHSVHENKVNTEYISKRLSLEGDSIAQWHYETKTKLGMLIHYIIRLGVLYLRDYPAYCINKVLKRNSFNKLCKIKRTKTYLKKSYKLMLKV